MASINRNILIRRFWEKVDKNGPEHPTHGRCWLWLPYKHMDYVRDSPAARKAYSLFNGKIIDGNHVCHHCDNRHCVRPEHLFQGTNLDNRLDSVRKQRHAHGERHGQVRLTDEQVADIRARYRRISYHQSNKNQLAEEYGIHPEYLGLLIRKSYRKGKTVERK